MAIGSQAKEVLWKNLDKDALGGYKMLDYNLKLRIVNKSA